MAGSSDLAIWGRKSAPTVPRAGPTGPENAKFLAISIVGRRTAPGSSRLRSPPGYDRSSERRYAHYDHASNPAASSLTTHRASCSRRPACAQGLKSPLRHCRRASRNNRRRSRRRRNCRDAAVGRERSGAAALDRSGRRHGARDEPWTQGRAAERRHRGAEHRQREVGVHSDAERRLHRQHAQRQSTDFTQGNCDISSHNMRRHGRARSAAAVVRQTLSRRLERQPQRRTIGGIIDVQPAARIDAERSTSRSRSGAISRSTSRAAACCRPRSRTRSPTSTCSSA